MKANALLEKIDAKATLVLKWICVAALIGLTLIATADVFVSIYSKIASKLIEFGISLPAAPDMDWQTEIDELLFGYMVFFGSAAIWIEKGHFSAGDWIERRIKNARVRAAYQLILELICIFFVLVFFKYSSRLASLSRELSQTLSWQKWIWYLCMPVSAAIIILYSGRFIVEDVARIINPGPENPPERADTEP